MRSPRGAYREKQREYGVGLGEEVAGGNSNKGDLELQLEMCVTASSGDFSNRAVE